MPCTATTALPWWNCTAPKIFLAMMTIPKFRKKILCLFLAGASCILPAALHAQDIDANPKKAEKDTLIIAIGPVMSRMNKATGRILQNNGKWKAAPNKIPFLEPEYNNPYYELFPIGADNFTEITLRRMRANGKLMYLLIWERRKARAKGGELDGYDFFKVADYYCIDSGRLLALKPPGFNFSPSTFAVSLPVRYTGTVGSYRNLGQMENFIKADINNNARVAHLYDTSVHVYFQFLWQAANTKTGKEIRFNPSLSYAQTGGTVSTDNMILFEMQYYAISYADWLKWNGSWVSAVRPPAAPKPRPR